MSSAFTLPSALYAILDVDLAAIRGYRPLDVLDHWLEAGVRLVQLRAKTLASGELLALADAFARRCRAAGAVFIVNDRADLAGMAGADGVHVGQDDLPPSDVRRMLGDSAVIGVSTHTDAQLDAACAQPVSYIAMGPVFSTRTKRSDNAAVGLNGVGRASARARAAGVPVVAIGGITLETAASVLAAGADAVAVISDLLAEDAAVRARKYLQVVAT